MFNIIKTNITHSPRDQMVSAIEHLCVGYYDAITKKKACAHVNQRNVVKYIMFSHILIFVTYYNNCLLLSHCAFVYCCTSHPLILGDSARVIEDIIEVKPIT